MKAVWNIPGVLKKVGDKLPDAMELVGQFVKSEAKNLCPVVTSNLKNSIAHEVVGGTVARIGSPVEYAAAVELGTKPHIIEPKNAEALKFEIGGKTVFAKRVNHPGTQAHPFLRPAVFNNKQKIIGFFKNLI
jgi:phage gpG-like protein